MTELETVLTLVCLDGPFAIVRLEPSVPVPDWTDAAPWRSIVRTPEELSIVCDEHVVPSEIPAERGWRALKVRGPLPFTMVGVLASLSAVLARADVSILAISTFETDYILVPGPKFNEAVAALVIAGFAVELAANGGAS